MPAGPPPAMTQDVVMVSVAMLSYRPRPGPCGDATRSVKRGSRPLSGFSGSQA